MDAAQAPDPDTALRALAYALSRSEVLAAIASMGSWQDLRHGISVMARARPLRESPALLWSAWQRYPTEPLILELLRETGDAFGAEGVVQERFRRDWLGWIKAGDPVTRIVRWSDDFGIPWRDLPTLEESPLAADTPLVRLVFHRTLQVGSTEQLDEMDTPEILAGWHQMSGRRHMAACANFLERIEPASWPEDLLEEIRDNYGLPGGLEANQTFWESVSEDPRQAFRLHFITRELEIAFEGDSTPDRRDFWMSQRRDIVSVCHGQAGSANWSRIDFQGFSVIEFFEVGNAAYFYQKGDPILTRIRPGAVFWSPSRLKRIDPGVGGSGNRLLHHDRWETTAQGMLEEWNAHHSQPRSDRSDSV